MPLHSPMQPSGHPLRGVFTVHPHLLTPNGDSLTGWGAATSSHQSVLTIISHIFLLVKPCAKKEKLGLEKKQQMWYAISCVGVSA